MQFTAAQLNMMLEYRELMNQAKQRNDRQQAQRYGSYIMDIVNQVALTGLHDPSTIEPDKEDEGRLHVFYEDISDFNFKDPDIKINRVVNLHVGMSEGSPLYQDMLAVLEKHAYTKH